MDDNERQIFQAATRLACAAIGGSGGKVVNIAPKVFVDLAFDLYTEMKRQCSLREADGHPKAPG